MKIRRIRWLFALLMNVLMAHAQAGDINLADNGDGTWSPNVEPEGNVTMSVEYEDILDFTDRGDGTWVLAAMPDYDVKLEVECEDDLESVVDLIYNDDGTWIPERELGVNVKMYIEYEDILDFTDRGDGTWVLAAMPDYNVKLVVEYVDEQLNLTANSDGAGNYWVTYYNGEAGYSADDNTTVYTALLSTDKTKVVLTEVADRTIPAGNAVVMKSTAADIAMTYDATATGTLADNDLKGSDEALVTPENTYMLVNGASGVGFYHWTGSTVPAGKAYLTLDSGAALARVFISFIEGDGGTTGVGTIPATEGNDDGTFYDLMGRKIGAKPTVPGIYVKNGKKVVVK